ncbi:alpha/beta hydrolase [Jannaschia rubra]|uniref:Monoterpene epsilon-lactone hydrolase n=1 Tax=Jannaschia rubra TaxID=282197 RepID=A0A0M6XQN4_9RHOB|nr:alpha/beta hydrolase [Jannaschia rubra]CTQ32907.1 Monoterpene epsilon-lactone hydrolase [Jannaschia rubra]SFG27917.1 Acetyl esterase/lipase [Jannaschia rubra]
MTWRDRALVALCRRLVKPALAVPVPWPVLRQAFHLVAPPTSGDCDVRMDRSDIAGVSCGVFTPRDAEGILVWLHGGGFILGSSRSYAGLARALARRTGRRVIVPDYRLAPENPFPAGHDDCIAVVRGIAAGGPFALGGDSAGGTLALTTLAALLPERAGPERLILASPAVDLNPGRPAPDGRDDILFPIATLRRIARTYVAENDPSDPRISPIHARFDGAPPVLIQCAEGEILEEDADLIAERLRSFGAAVEMQKTGGVPHVWQLFADRTPKADSAVAAMAEFLS